MSEDRKRQISQLFDEALDVPADERRDFLRRSSDGDESLCAEVLSLMEHLSGAPQHFMKSARIGEAKRPVGPRERLATGQRIGQYTVREVLAHGGMGTVYLADQDSPQRVVAVKVLHLDSTKAHLGRRFAAESRILAYLNHPHIAQVFDAGTFTDKTSTAVPYFVMEYVQDAMTITKYSDQFELSTHERLEMFAHVCDAVYHGHQKGIIHRDLKPANILVDNTGQTKVIDFGVARSIDSDIALTTIDTDAGQILGTIQYMSPEQCDGDSNAVDTRSDVYSLGVVLYELLSGQLPYDASGTIYQAIRVIMEAKPQDPARIKAGLRGDVSILVLRALAKDRDERYQSVSDLARDIRHYLAHEPIEARAPTTWARATRWALRHPVYFTVATCLTLATVILGAALTYLNALASIPHHTEVAYDGRSVTLCSAAGVELTRWSVDPPGELSFAKVLDRQGSGRGSRQLLLGLNQATTLRQSRGSDVHQLPLDFAPRFSGIVAVPFAADFADGPTWIGTVEVTDLPDGADWPSHEFRPLFARQFEIFEASPGPEILAVHDHVGHARAIRIYSREGEILYQVWHSGTVRDAIWVEETGMLVCVGFVNNREWVTACSPEGRDAIVNPIFVFSIKPRPDVRLRSFLSPSADDTRLKPVWASQLLPEDCGMMASNRLRPPAVGEDTFTKCVRLAIVLEKRRNVGLSLLVDEQGREVVEKRSLADAYRLDQESAAPEFLKPDKFSLQPCSHQSPR